MTGLASVFPVLCPLWPEDASTATALFQPRFTASSALAAVEMQELPPEVAYYKNSSWRRLTTFYCLLCAFVGMTVVEMQII